MTMNETGRRRFLQGLGAGLTLPFLRSRTVEGQDGRPLRFVVVYHPIGTLVDRWRPSGVGASYGMSDLLAPLERHRDDMLVLSGISNRFIGTLAEGEVSHAAAAHSLLTGQPMTGIIGPDGRRTGADMVDGRPPVGPSFDQVIADNISASAGAGLRSMHLSVGPSYPGEYSTFWRSRPDGSQEWIANQADPQEVFDGVFRDVETTEPTMRSFRDRLRAHSGSIMDNVHASYGRLARGLPVSDIRRLEAHAARLRELEENLRVNVEFSGSCSQPALDLPGGGRWFDDVVHSTIHAQNQSELLAMALACDVTRVGTLQFTHSHGQRFLDVPGYRVPDFGHSDWHAMVHNDSATNVGDPLFRGYEWYSHRVAEFIDRLKSIEDGDGTLLDNTVVLWISEFGDGGGHTVEDLPVVLFGGPLRKGQHRDCSGHTVNELYIGLAERFGIELEGFGWEEFGGERFADSPIDLS